MPVTNEHQPKLKLRTGKPFPPRTHLKKFQCKTNGKINFQPPLSDGSSDSPAVNANPCPSVTGIASNRQNYIQIASPFSRAIRKSFRPLNNMENSIFPPPLGHPSSDSPAVDANPCPSVTGIASNRQNYSNSFSLFPGPSENHSAMEITWKSSIFPPPLGHPSSDSPAVDANPCPSVTGIASNRQNYIQIASPFSRAIRKSFRMEITWKIRFFHRRSVTRRPIHPAARTA
jgi:hypothetical protein